MSIVSFPINNKQRRHDVEQVVVRNKQAIDADRRYRYLLRQVMFLFLIMLHSASSMMMMMMMDNRKRQKQHHHHHHTLTSKKSNYKSPSSFFSYSSSLPPSSSRRKLFLQSPTLILAISTLCFVDQTRTTNNEAIAATTTTEGDVDDSRIYRFTSGLQFRNIRIGRGPIITRQNYTSIVIHLRAMTTDGLVLFDTRNDREGSPILYGLQQQQSQRSKVTEGVEDAILSRGILVETGDRVEPMREGGIRKVIVPGDLAYGHEGISRYDAFVKLGLNHPVPRDEVILYQIEILRCLNVEIQRPSPSSDADGEETNNTQETTTLQACCAEENYPCKGPEE